MKKAGWLLLAGLAAARCGGAGAEGEKHDTVAVAGPGTPAAREANAHPDLVTRLERLPLVEPDYKDTVRWASCDSGEFLPPETLEALSLGALTHGERPAKMSLLHRLGVPGDFYTVEVSYCPSENEIRYYLVTYSKKLEMLGKSEVAANELAEGLLSAYSVIRRNAIERHAFNYTNEENPETVTRFVITEQGAIVEQ